MIEQQTRATLIDRLPGLIERAITRNEALDRPTLVSVSEEIDAVDPLRLFANSESFAADRWFWERPQDGVSIAGIAAAMTMILPPAVRFHEANRLQRELASTAIIDAPEGVSHPGPLFFCGFSFDPETRPDHDFWKGFPNVIVTVPRVTLTRRDGRCILTLNLEITHGLGAETALGAAQDIYDRTREALRTDLPDNEPSIAAAESEVNERIAGQYQENVALGSQAIREGAFEKVVLARYQDIQSDRAFNIPAALDRLRSDYPGCYTFAVARQASVFLGATPEQLIKQDQQSVTADCLAGSIRRGANPDEDAELARNLIDSQKDQQEHEICARAIAEALEPFCAELNAPERPELVTFSNVHHLFTPITGELRNGSSLIQLVERLHPTPAVGGYPKAPSQAFIREHEGFDRGWYGAPIGWIDSAGNGEFIVALRSAIVTGNRARLFAGCGIVGQSDPDQELAESEVKLRPMLAALGSHPS